MYTKRTEALSASVKADMIYITSPENLQYYSGFTGGEAWLVLATEGLVQQWEPDLGVLGLLDRWLAALAGCELLHLHYLD